MRIGLLRKPVGFCVAITLLPSTALAQSTVPRGQVVLSDPCSASPPGQGTDVTGTWDATLVADGLQYDMALTLVQTETRVTGTAAVEGEGPGNGSFNGTVSGTTLNFTINEVSPCAGIFAGNATISADGLTTTGTMSGADCFGVVSSTITGTKQYAPSPPPPNTANATGTWTTLLNIDNFLQVGATFTFVQSATSVTGTVAMIAGFGSGSITGTVSGQTLNFTIHEVSPCVGTFSGAVTISGNDTQANGTGSGTDCAGFDYSAEISAAKQ